MICKIGDKFYEVSLEAEIFGAKQDIGDKLYWVEDIKNVKWKEIDKPLPRVKKLHELKLMLSLDQYKNLRTFIKDNKINVLYHKHNLIGSVDLNSFEVRNSLM
ncbi:hypothetical protein D3C76_1290380 [compost metagenome]